VRVDCRKAWRMPGFYFGHVMSPGSVIEIAFYRPYLVNLLD